MLTEIAWPEFLLAITAVVTRLQTDGDRMAKDAKSVAGELELDITVTARNASLFLQAVRQERRRVYRGWPDLVIEVKQPDMIEIQAAGFFNAIERDLTFMIELLAMTSLDTQSAQTACSLALVNVSQYRS